MTGAEVRDLCLSLPEVTEKATWGDEETPGHPTFRVRDKIFVIMGSDERGGTIKTSAGEQAELISGVPRRRHATRRTSGGSAGWMSSSRGIPDEILREVLQAAWARTAPKKLAAAWQDAR